MGSLAGELTQGGGQARASEVWMLSGRKCIT